MEVQRPRALPRAPLTTPSSSAVGAYSLRQELPRLARQRSSLEHRPSAVFSNLRQARGGLPTETQACHLLVAFLETLSAPQSGARSALQQGDRCCCHPLRGQSQGPLCFVGKHRLSCIVQVSPVNHTVSQRFYTEVAPSCSPMLAMGLFHCAPRVALRACLQRAGVVLLSPRRLSLRALAAEGPADAALAAFVGGPPSFERTHASPHGDTTVLGASVRP